MLLFNNVDKNDIIYSNSDDPEANLPETNIYDYLRDFLLTVHQPKKYLFYLLQVIIHRRGLVQVGVF